jgi:hypothetical protein
VVSDQDLLPLDARTGRPIPRTKQPGYYPKYSTLSQKKFWDATTRRTVEERVAKVPPIRFFSATELPLITAVCNRVLPQDDRLPEYRIPIVPWIDERLWKNEIDGYRFEDMPEDREAYRLGVRAINETAHAMYGRDFVALEPIDQDAVLKTIHDGEERAAHEIWRRMSINRFWHLIVQDCVTAYYSHPWAWDEVGYGGPAYPRAYTRLEGGLPEPWEVDEKRYEWRAPASSLSDGYDQRKGATEKPTHGQGGTH